MKGHGRRKFEKGRFPIPLVNRFNGFVGVNDPIIGNGLSVDTDPFIEMNEVGRGVLSDLMAGQLEDRCQGGGHRPFSVRAGHMDALESFLGIAKSRQNSPDGRQPQDNAETPQAVHRVQARLISIVGCHKCQVC